MSRQRVVGVFTLVALLLLMTATAFAATGDYAVPGSSYELKDGSEYTIKNQTSKASLCYGAGSIGTLTLHGALPGTSEFNDVIAYGADGELTMSYSYNGAYHDQERGWYIESSDSKKVAGVSIDKKVNNGTVIVQKSENGSTWGDPVFVENNVFAKKSSGLTDFFTISENDVREGCYYRVLVAYRMARNTGSEKVVAFVKKDTYEYREFVEVYEFYVSYNKNPVKLVDIETGNDVSFASKVSKGFIVDTRDTAVDVAVRKDSGTTRHASNLDRFTDPGTYQITITTELGRTFSYSIKITEGLKMTAVSPQIHDGGKNGEYSESDPTVARTEYGLPSLTSLYIAQQHNTQMKKSVYNGFDAYGVSGETIGLYLKIKDFTRGAGNGWEIASDTWGKKDKQTVWGAQTGEICTGALVIQTSSDGENWENIQAGAYANGLYTTDYYTHYGNRGDVLIYMPRGKAVLDGVYLRIIYAYRAEQQSTKTEKRYAEVYELYLCSNELNAVTFHNLTVKDNIKDFIKEDVEGSVDVYKEAETLVNGSSTVKGFEIDISKNPTVDVTVYKNGQKMYIPANKRFTAAGRYEIHLKSDVGDKKIIVIYVDNQTAEAALSKYFGESFITGKRIFSYGDIPKYEGGLTNCELAPVDGNYLPIHGTIKNTTTGEIYTMSAGATVTSYNLTAPGSYIATFTTQPENNGEPLPGDYRVFTFRFEIIAEGTAPGPVYNEDKLLEYNTKFATDAYPKYYGLVFRAGKGDITLAFASKEVALQYAYNYEKGLVEEQSDGSYRYKGPYGLLGQKESYDSLWDLTDATQYFAEQAVHEYFFDMSDEFTYRSLAPEVIAENPDLEELNLKQSVVIFADGEKEKSAVLDAYPIINDKITAYLDIETGEVVTTWEGFEFVTDKFGGIDSQKVIITDVNGKEYPIHYSSSAGKQLEEQGCPSGIISITETTKYGDSRTYQAIYIAPGDNQSKVSLICYNGLSSREVVIDHSNKDLQITADSFSIKSIADQLDPYALVIVKHLRETHAYVAGETPNDIWSDPGEYQIKCVNRMGYGYSFSITVVESDNAVISFAGAGTENLTSILTTYGSENIELPTLSRYGYDFVGYIHDRTAQTYSLEIPQVTFRGDQTLTAVWVPKKLTVTLCDETGVIIDTLDVEFGRTYDLPAFVPKQGYEFAGWSNSGTLVEGSSVTVDTEDSIVLSACVIQKEVESPKLEEPKESNDRYAWLWLIAAIVAAVAVLVWKKDKLKRIAKERSGEIDKPEDEV